MEVKETVGVMELEEDEGEAEEEEREKRGVLSWRGRMFIVTESVEEEGERKMLVVNTSDVSGDE